MARMMDEKKMSTVEVGSCSFATSYKFTAAWIILGCPRKLVNG